MALLSAGAPLVSALGAAGSSSALGGSLGGLGAGLGGSFLNNLLKNPTIDFAVPLGRGGGLTFGLGGNTQQELLQSLASAFTSGITNQPMGGQRNGVDPQVQTSTTNSIPSVIRIGNSNSNMRNDPFGNLDLSFALR